MFWHQVGTWRHGPAVTQRRAAAPLQCRSWGRRPLKIHHREVNKGVSAREEL